MLNAEIEDEIECVFTCEGAAVADKIHINSSHVQAPAPPRYPALLASMLPSLHPEDTSLILSRCLSHRFPLFCAFFRCSSWTTSKLPFDSRPLLHLRRRCQPR